MARYTSRTGSDVLLRFKGTEITIPANGYYESTAEDLATLFPKHIRKIEINDVIRQIERRLLPVNIKVIKTPKLVPITLAIEPLQSPALTPITINSVSEIPLTQIKEVQVTSLEREKIISNLIQNTTDPDLKEFLQMIEDILKEK